MDGKFERLVEFSPAYDKRNPNPDKNYGIHGVEIRFVLKGLKGATQFVIYTSWYLPHVQRELYGKGELNSSLKYGGIEPMGTDIGYHSPISKYEGQKVMSDHCPYLDGKPCYYDGSSLRAGEFIPEFLEGGDKAVWKMLEDEYGRRFHDKNAQVNDADNPAPPAKGE
jgi:hypothetical protein